MINSLSRVGHHRFGVTIIAIDTEMCGLISGSSLTVRALELGLNTHARTFCLTRIKSNKMKHNNVIATLGGLVCVCECVVGLGPSRRTHT